MATTLSKQIGESYARLNVLKYEHKKISSKQQEVEDVNRFIKNLNELMKREELLLEKIEKDASKSDDKEFLEFYVDMISPTHEIRKELYQSLRSHTLADSFDSILEQLDDLIDYSGEVINDIKLKISLLESNFLVEIDKLSWH